MHMAIDQEKIREQAKKIMDEFIASLDKADGSGNLFGEEREQAMREKLVKKDGADFRKKMFENAPKKNDEFIIAEKKKW